MTYPTSLTTTRAPLLRSKTLMTGFIKPHHQRNAYIRLKRVFIVVHLISWIFDEISPLNGQNVKSIIRFLARRSFRGDAAMTFLLLLLLGCQLTRLPSGRWREGAVINNRDVWEACSKHQLAWQSDTEFNLIQTADVPANKVHSYSSPSNVSCIQLFLVFLRKILLVLKCFSEFQQCWILLTVFSSCGKTYFMFS